jgi:penicillin-binding protein 1C
MLSYSERYRANQIENMACLVADVKTGNVLAYCGNVFSAENPVDGMSVDVITAQRSSGSVLKPVLYAAMLDDGLILPQTLVSDIPMLSKGFAPKNYNRTFEGAVAANQVVIRSLNVPSVKMLQSYGVNKFRVLLQNCGLSTITRSADDYGLSLILGGAEISLWEIAQFYMSVGRKLQHLSPRGLTMTADSTAGVEPELGDAALWIMAKTLCELNRPEEEQGWQWFDNNKNISWKTGTSYGNRDGWSIGFTSRHVVAVWVGNANGEGRPGLTGVGYAAPIMFSVFSLLPYAEVVAGSGRLCLCVRRATLLALLGSIAGTLLSFYLVFVAAYSLLTPLALQAFLLLWTLPVLLMADRSGRY